MSGPPCTLDWDEYDGTLFDLDGVITDTAQIHASCWKRMFDEFLRARAESNGERFRPFDEVSEYLSHVDGRPRIDGIRTFLAARGIELPEGAPDDPADAETVFALGNRKNVLVLEAIEGGAVRVYDSSIELVRALHESGRAVAVVTSSANCQAILGSVGLLDLLPIRIDGCTIAERGLRGKPAPDAFLAGAETLGIPPARLVVFEDAVSGIEAGRSGGFGLVVGIARHDNAGDLRTAGADVVVADLADLEAPLSGGRRQ